MFDRRLLWDQRQRKDWGEGLVRPCTMLGECEIGMKHTSVDMGQVTSSRGRRDGWIVTSIAEL